MSDGTIVGIYKRIGENNQGCLREIGAIENYKDHTACTVNWIGFIDVNGSSLPNKLVSCSSGADDMTKNDSIVKNNAKHMTDVYFIRFHDGIVKPASAATRYVLQTAK